MRRVTFLPAVGAILVTYGVCAGQTATSIPVLLVPGWFDTGRNMAPLRLRLLAAGWPASHVVALTFRDPTGSNREHASEIDSAAADLLEGSGASQLDIVAHSMGGLATRLALERPHAPPVRRVIFLATPHRGTWAAYVAWGAGGAEMEPGSPFLDSLNARPPLPRGVEAMTIRTPLDTHILPEESATLPGVPDHVVCCPTHEGLVSDMEAFRLIRRFLAEPDSSAAPDEGNVIRGSAVYGGGGS